MGINTCKQCGRHFSHSPIYDGFTLTPSGLYSSGINTGFCSKGCLNAYRAEKKQSKEASNEAPVVMSKKKGCSFNGCLKGCLIVIILVGVIGAIISSMSSKKEEEALAASSAVTIEEATRNGEDLVAWIRNKRDMTDIARDDAFAKLKGKTVILRGKVREIGKTAFSEQIFVSLTIGQLEVMEKLNVQFNVRESQIEKVKAWNKDEVHAMRGRITSQGDLTDDAKCDIAEVVE